MTPFRRIKREEFVRALSLHVGRKVVNVYQHYGLKIMTELNPEEDCETKTHGFWAAGSWKLLRDGRSIWPDEASLSDFRESQQGQRLAEVLRARELRVEDVTYGKGPSVEILLDQGYRILASKGDDSTPWITNFTTKGVFVRSIGKFGFVESKEYTPKQRDVGP